MSLPQCDTSDRAWLLRAGQTSDFFAGVLVLSTQGIAREFCPTAPAISEEAQATSGVLSFCYGVKVRVHLTARHKWGEDAPT